MSSGSQISATSAASNLNMCDLETSFDNILTAIINPLPKVHTAPEEQKALEDVENKLYKLYYDGRAALRYRRNQLTHINRLPDEILAMIFENARDDSTSWEMFRYLPLTGICRRWRRVAEDCPALWRVIDLAYVRRNAEFLKEIVRRSKSADLVVGHLGSRWWRTHDRSVMDWAETRYTPAPCEVQEEYAFFKSYVAPALGRVKLLALKLPPYLWLDALPLLQNLSPSIRACQFRETLPQRHNDADDDDDAVFETDQRQPEDPWESDCFLSKVFQARRLLYLDVQFCHFPLAGVVPRPPQVPNLQVLLLQKDGHKSSTSSLSLEELLLVLESCCLELRALALSVLPPSTGKPHSRITMPNLRFISLETPEDTEVLAYLSTPALEHLRIDGENISDKNQISRCLDLSTLSYMKIIDDNVLGSKEFHPDGEEEQSNLRINLPFDTPDLALTTSLARQLSAWASHLRSLTLQGALSSHRTFALQKLILRHAHSLRSIELEVAFLHLLTFLEDVAICPDLETLVYVCGEWNRAPETPPARDLASLAEARGKGGAGLKELVLYSDMPMGARYEARIREWVGTLRLVEARPLTENESKRWQYHLPEGALSY